MIFNDNLDRHWIEDTVKKVVDTLMEQVKKDLYGE